MKGLWDELEPLLAKHAPALANALRPPVSEAGIARAEALMQVELPLDVREAYLRHDGCEPGGTWFFVPYFRWCSLQEMVERWKTHVEVMEALQKEDPQMYPSEIFTTSIDRKIRHYAWLPQWIPIGLSGMRPTLCVDLLPGDRGVRGQLIDHTGEGGDDSVLDTSFSSYIARLIDRLERGVLVYEGGAWYTQTHAPICTTWMKDW